MKRILLLFAVYALLDVSFSAFVDGISSTTTREGQVAGTSFYSGATSSSYTATHVDPSAGTAGADAGATSSTNGFTGAAQPQLPAAYYEQQENAVNSGGIGIVAPPELAPTFNVGTEELNAVLRPGEYVPNCGCVPRGACQREIGHYTRLVGTYSDVVCGLSFERCCFDGPCPGVFDEFVRAAACVPQEQCLRPYGVLPTDVRDFGIIAPCPGQGAVRCITVDDTQLLQFQAAVAAIEASQARYAAAVEAIAEEENLVVPSAAQSPAPQQIIVPIVPARAPAPQFIYTPQPQVIVAHEPQPIITLEPQPQVVVTHESQPVVTPEPQKPVVVAPQPHAVVPAPVTGQTTTVTTGTPDSGFLSNIATLLAENGISTPVQTVSKGETGNPTKLPPPRIPPPRVTTTYTTTGSKVPPTAAGFIETPAEGYDCRQNGCYTPWAYRTGCRGYGCGFRYGYPGYGYGGYGLGSGVGFQKSFHYSKGFSVFG